MTNGSTGTPIILTTKNQISKLYSSMITPD